MTSSNKKIILSTLLAGTAVATSTLIYGAYTGSGDDLIILDDTIPPVLSNGMLPPPATYRMSTPPPVEIPGIRRLKITRPSLTTATLTTDADFTSSAADNEARPSEIVASETSADEADFYLTGTRSAELIRTPVEARIETFPTVTLDEAVEGALAVDEWGFQVVQSYLNQAVGDTEILKQRMDALLNRIEEAAGDYDLATISDAANLIIEAGARTHWTAFMAPFVLDEGFELIEGAIGWDLGPETDKPYTDFIRVSPQSKMLEGNQGMASEASASGPSILSKGVRNLDAFVANNLKNGRYRVVILTAPRPNGQSPLYPFGVDVKRNGAKVNLVDTRATDDLVPVMKLATEGVGRLGESAATDDFSFNDTDTQPALFASASSSLSLSNHAMAGIDGFISSNTFNTLNSTSDYAPIVGAEASFQGVDSGGAPAAGHMLVTRAEVVDGTLRINFRQLGGQDTYITAVIIYPEPDQEIEQQLADEVADFINRVAPAAGENLSVENIVGTTLAIVDPVTSFNDNANGLPTTEAAAVTPQPAAQPTTDPEAETTTPASNPEPEPDAAAPVDNNRPEAETPDSSNPGGDLIGAPPAIDPAPEPGPDPAPEPGPDPAPEPGPDPAPEPGPDPAPEPGPDPAPEPGPDPAPEPGPDPAPEPGPDPAPEPQPVLIAEAGIYDVMPLGESFTLDACGSTFEDAAFCNLVDSSEFTLVWLLDGDPNNPIGTGESILVNSGSGTQFGTTGSYNVTLNVTYNNPGDGRFADFVTGGGLFLPGNTFNLTSSDTAIIRLIASVPEPSSLFLLAPGLVFVAARQRRRKKLAKPE